MTEWSVVGVLIALIGLVAAVVKPLLSLNSSITRLTAAVDTTGERLEELGGRNREAHRLLWEQSRRQGEALEKHESRLSVMEHKIS